MPDARLGRCLLFAVRERRGEPAVTQPRGHAVAYRLSLSLLRLRCQHERDRERPAQPGLSVRLNRLHVL